MACGLTSGSGSEIMIGVETVPDKLQEQTSQAFWSHDPYTHKHY